MAAKRGTQAGSFGALSTLDEGALVEVLRAAHSSRALTSLASSSRQLCTLARRGVPSYLRVITSAHAQRVLLSRARGRPPFSGCTSLHLRAGAFVDYTLAAGVTSTAQHWTALQEVSLSLQPDHFNDFCASALLSPLSALKQLRKLDLDLPHLGPCSIGHIGHLVQLTGLQLAVPKPAAAAAAAADTRLDLAPLSRLTNLGDLVVAYVAAPQPAAGALGPFCLPSSLTSLDFHYGAEADPAPLACWLTHLPGCPQLQQLEVNYGPQQHASAHPRAVIRLLAQHNSSLKELYLFRDDSQPPVWDAAVAGLPDAAAPAGGAWRPGAALAALTGLEVLHEDGLLTIAAESDWQHMAQLTALTKLNLVMFQYAPPLQAGTCLGVLELNGCKVALSGHDMGRLLLACPQLHTALLTITGPLVPAPADSCGGQLQPHPRLQDLWLGDCHSGGSAAATATPPPQAAAAATGAAAHLDALAPVLKGLSKLTLSDWPSSISGRSTGSPVRGNLPDLSSCTALTHLVFCIHDQAGPNLVPPEQEAFLAMLSPLVQLQALRVQGAPRLNARAVLVLQGMLPQLRSVELWCCGRQKPLMPAGSTRQQEQQALDGVMQLLRPGLLLNGC